MWSYEIVLEYPDRSDLKAKKNSVPMKQVSSTIVADDDKKVLDFAMEELKRHEDHDLIAIVRRNAIVRIMTD